MVPPRKRVVIPQGHSIEEWLHCLEYLDAAVDFRTLGIPKHLERCTGGRAEALKGVLRKGLEHFYDIHLFGFCKNPVRELVAATTVYKQIRGVDSGAALAYACQDKYVELENEHISLNWDVAERMAENHGLASVDGFETLLTKRFHANMRTLWETANA